MPLWTLFGLRKGKATTDWQEGDQEDRDNGQDGVLGMPRFEPRRYAEECVECARICPTAAIRVSPKQTGRARLEVDYGRCVVCQLCVEVCPTDAATTSRDWALGTRDRFDLLFSNDDVHIIHKSAGPHSRSGFRRSCISVMLTRGPAMAASWGCGRSTIPSTTCTGSASSSRRRRASPTFCWSLAP